MQDFPPVVLQTSTHKGDKIIYHLTGLNFSNSETRVAFHTVLKQ